MSPTVFWGVRLGLYGLGAGLLVVGALLAFGDPGFPRLIGVAVWLGCAIVLHDAILVPTLTLVGRLRDATGRRIGLHPAATRIASGAVAVGAVLTLAVLPELWAQHLGPANPTVLPGDYGVRLLAVWAALAVVAVVAIVTITLRTRRRGAAR